MFVGLLTRTVSTYNQAKCVLLSNQKCMTRSTLIILHPNKWSQEFHYYPLPVNLDRCVRSCNTLCDLSNRLCVANKKKRFKSKSVQYDYRNKWICQTIHHANVNVNLMLESVIQSKSGIIMNFDASVKNIIYVEKIIFGILLHAVAKMVNI